MSKSLVVNLSWTLKLSTEWEKYVESQIEYQIKMLRRRLKFGVKLKFWVKTSNCMSNWNFDLKGHIKNQIEILSQKVELCRIEMFFQNFKSCVKLIFFVEMSSFLLNWYFM